MPNEQTRMTTDDVRALGGLLTFPNPIYQCAQEVAAQMDSPSPSPAGELTYITAEVRDLRAEVERLRAERDQLLQMQSRVLELLGTERPDRLVHDLRNVLNERALFRALAETQM